ncbi:sugar transferase [Nocardia uniformis]|uniref:Sugar transferase n=1 Tax=Nocardia uniformis TaxID=53432 RepID=A0A849BWZ2_9NOCA|nr:sugar transferase [Nocardia uniformis]NNH70784.1 sugar transferase [Nocardia uniformis]
MSSEIAAGRDIRSMRLPRATPRSERERWQVDYVRVLWISDLLVICLAVVAAQAIRFGGPIDPPLTSTLPLEVRYSVVSALFALAWYVAVGLSGARSPRVIGSGTEEYRGIIAATLRLFGVVAIVSLVLQVDIARGYLAIALPLGTLGLISQRRLWRRWVVAQRARGEYRIGVLVVGSRDAARAMVAAFSRDPASGYNVIGVCTPEDGELVDPALEVGDRDIPVVGDDRSILEAVKRTGADTVAVTATDNLGPADFRRIAWELDPLGVELIVVPGLVDISGARLTHRLVADMPMLHVEKPRYDRATSIRKAVFDIGFALGALVLTAPVLLAIAAAVKLSSRGPVCYRSERIGRDGRPFQMMKFRSMYVDTDAHLNALIESGGGDRRFADPRDDPRVTPIGRLLRTYGLDELPQFLNVLRGEMSIVGPRPQVRREVDSYDGTMRRRLLVRPGVTGLWQVNGRANPTPEDALRRDLSYVENWSPVLDVLLIAKTIGAVAKGDR